MGKMQRSNANPDLTPVTVARRVAIPFGKQALAKGVRARSKHRNACKTTMKEGGFPRSSSRLAALSGDGPYLATFARVPAGEPPEKWPSG